MKNKLATLSFICVVALTLMAGCAQNEENKTVEGTEQTSSLLPTEDTKKDNSENESNNKTIDSKENYYYTLESETPLMLDTSNKKESIKYKEPYKNYGKAIVTPEIQEEIEGELGNKQEQSTEEVIEPTDNLEQLEDKNEKDNSEVENSEVENNEVEVIPQEEIPQGPSEEDIKAFKHKELAYKLNHLVVYDIFQNGIMLMDNVKSENDFNNNHKVNLQIVFRNTQKNLETIENIGETINEEFDTNAELLEAWKNLYKELKEYRETLNIMDSQQEVITNKDKLGSKTFMKLVNNFSTLISKDIGDYKPGTQLTNTIVDIDNTTEVGEVE